MIKNSGSCHPQLSYYTEQFALPYIVNLNAVAYSEPCETSKMELLAKTVNDWKPLTIFANSSILVVSQSSEYYPAM